MVFVDIKYMCRCIFIFEFFGKKAKYVWSKAGRASLGDKPARILSRTVERVEEEIIAGLMSHLKEQGWVTSSLIHDEIVVQHSNRFLNPNEELQSLCHNSKLGFRAFEDSRGWPPGSLRVDVQRL